MLTCWRPCCFQAGTFGRPIVGFCARQKRQGSNVIAPHEMGHAFGPFAGGILHGGP